MIDTNATSLNNKLDILEASINFKKPDIIFISETWFRDDSCPNLPGYYIYRRDRNDGRAGRGVCLYIRNNINSVYFLDHDLGIRQPDVESIWSILSFNSENILIGCIYRPGDSSQSVNDEINKIFYKIRILLDSNKITGLLVAGDFNFGDIMWTDNQSLNSGPSLNFKDSLEDNFILQNVNRQTFQLDNGLPGNILDLILTESDQRIFSIDYDDPLGYIHKAHLVLHWKYYTKCPRENNDFKAIEKVFRRGNYSAMNNFFNKIDWDFECESVQNFYDKFIEIYNEACDKYVSSNYKKFQNNKPS